MAEMQDMVKPNDMVELMESQRRQALPLFAVKSTQHIARSCCMELVPCRIFVDRADHPTAAVVVLRVFGVAFAAGDRRHAPALLEMLRGWHPWYAFSDPPEDWAPAFAAWSRESHAAVRYSFGNDPRSLNPAHLTKLAMVPQGCTLLPYDRHWLQVAREAQWSEDQLGAYADVDAFMREGMGYALLCDGKLVAGCTSFCTHPDGYEIQVDTHPDYRGRGYATVVAAAFMHKCLQLGKTPYWDAANSTSLRLAQKLGYVFESAALEWMLISPSTTVEQVAQKAIGP